MFNIVKYINIHIHLSIIFYLFIIFYYSYFYSLLYKEKKIDFSIKLPEIKIIQKLSKLV
jgi:hypothetical protein